MFCGFVMILAFQATLSRLYKVSKEKRSKGKTKKEKKVVKSVFLGKKEYFLSEKR